MMNLPMIFGCRKSWKLRAGLALLPMALLLVVVQTARTQSPASDAAATSQPAALSFRSGPLLGYAGTNFLTVACRTSKDATVTLKMDGRSFKSGPTTMHAFKVEGLKPGTEYEYSLTAEGGGESADAGPYKTHTLPDGKTLTFAMFGDSRSNPLTWNQVAAAVKKAHPDFALLVGDYVTDARRDTWDEECFIPARDFFATVPCFAVAGNHDMTPDGHGHSDASAMFKQMFLTPTGNSDWTARVGPVFLVGINGRMKFDEDGEQQKWLNDSLNQSDTAPYAFLLSHFPAWSSTKYGKVDQYGLLDRDVQRAREYILPLLVKHHFTAMLCGHAHGYERCELPGITQMWDPLESTCRHASLSIL